MNIFLKEATEGYEKVIGDQLRQNPRLLVSDSFAAFENVIHNKTAYFGVYYWNSSNNVDNNSRYNHILEF